MAKDALRFLGDFDNSLNCDCDLLDKSNSNFIYIQYMFDRTNRMFRYKNLPDTIPEYMLEYMLQVYGSIAIISHNSDIYAIRCHFGGPPDPYYRPTQAVIANPALNITTTFQITNYLPPFERSTWDSMPHCIRVHNDTQIMGLFPLFSRYAVQLTENDISIRSAQINLREQRTIIADTGPEIESANSYMKGLEEGHLTAIMKRPFADGIQVIPTSHGANVVTQLVELQQYLKASWYNEIGLQSNFNMKRSYLSEDELQSSEDIMLPLVDNMFECRKVGVDQINKEFGTNISVEKDSAWEEDKIRQMIQELLPKDSVQSTELSTDTEPESLSEQLESSNEESDSKEGEEE